jgi:hypothetical protein
MPLENRDLETGTRLAARYKGKPRTCEVVQTEDGLRYQTDDGELFNSPSSAAKHVMGGIAANGWRFWSIEGELKARRERKPKAEEPAKNAKAKPTKKAKSKKARAKKPKGKSVRAASKNDSYGCGACSETFATMKAATKHAMTHVDG